MSKFVKIFLFLCLAGFASISQSQTTDLARIEYTYFPQSSSDNSFSRFKSFVNFPIKLNDKGAYLVPGVEYQNINFKYKDPAVFNTSELERFQSFSFNLGYTFKVSEDWRFGSEGGVKVASNFERSRIIADDIVYSGALYFIKIKEDEQYIEPTRLILGLEYSTSTRFPFPLPVINYYKRFDPKWSYSLGVPKSNLKYYFNDKNSMQGFVTLDGFFANVQNNFDINPDNPSSNALAESVSMTILLSGMGYEYNFTKHISFYIYGGHTIINDIRLRDENLDKVYTINDKNSFYGRSGLKLSIL
jgi:hypothetical protein